MTASLFATLNEMFGNGTVCGIGRGDRRTRHERQADNRVEMREATHVIRRAGELLAGRLQGLDAAVSWAHKSTLEVWVAAYGPMAGRPPARWVTGTSCSLPTSTSLPG